MENPQVVPNPPENGLDLPEGLRKYLINKVVQVLVPHPDINAEYDARMLEFTEYVKYLERKAFEKAETNDEYYSSLAKVVFRIKKNHRMRPRITDDSDPYKDIPPPHQLADFMGLTQEELEEFDEEQNPQGPSEADILLHKDTITDHIRRKVLDKLGSMLFPPPDAFAYYDGRMDTISKKLKKIELEAYRECEDRDDYYNIASLKSYRLQKWYKRSGKSYVDRVVYYPALIFRTEVVE